MPCTDAGDYADCEQKLVHKDDVVVHKKDFDLMKARLDEATRAGCEAMKALKRRKGLDSVTTATREWYARHEAEDLKQKKRQQATAKKLQKAIKASGEALAAGDLRGAFKVLEEHLKKV